MRYSGFISQKSLQILSKFIKLLTKLIFENDSILLLHPLNLNNKPKMDFFLRTLSPEVFLRSSSAKVLESGGTWGGLCSGAAGGHVHAGVKIFPLVVFIFFTQGPRFLK